MNDTLLIPIIFIFGSIIGSFLNVVIYRLPREKSIVYPPSSCPSCRYKIKWYENIPIISYLFLRGKCRQCKAKIPLRYPFVEFITGLGAVFIYIKWGLTLDSLFYFIFLSLIIAIIFIDIDFKIIPDELNLIGFISGIIFSFFRNDFSFVDAVLGSIVGAGFLFLTGYLYMKLRKIEGLGMGDVKMMAFVGAYLGLFGSLFTIFFGSLLGAVVGITLSLLKEGKYQGTLEIPFGPFLGISAIIYMFFGDYIKQIYFGGF